MKRHVLMTGRPGIGKTTLIKNLVNQLEEGIVCRGIYTEEVRAAGVDGRKIGFDIVTLAGCRTVLARAGSRGGCRVGPYVVNVSEFERVALPAISATRDALTSVIVIDEMGKMELMSERFCTVISEIFNHSYSSNDGSVIVIATVPLPRPGQHRLLDDLADRHDVHVLHVTAKNRDTLAEQAISIITQIYCDITHK